MKSFGVVKKNKEQGVTKWPEDLEVLWNYFHYSESHSKTKSCMRRHWPCQLRSLINNLQKTKLWKCFSVLLLLFFLRNMKRSTWPNWPSKWCHQCSWVDPSCRLGCKVKLSHSLNLFAIFHFVATMGFNLKAGKNNCIDCYCSTRAALTFFCFFF